MRNSISSTKSTSDIVERIAQFIEMALDGGGDVLRCNIDGVFLDFGDTIKAMCEPSDEVVSHFSSFVGGFAGFFHGGLPSGFGCRAHLTSPIGGDMLQSMLQCSRFNLTPVLFSVKGVYNKNFHMAQTVIIKKYENRRLYDATNSRYVNLEEVAQLVQQGHNVQVVDASSGEDLTRQILTQIIAEGAKNSESTFPLDILRQMVIASDRVGQESAVRYTQAMRDLYKNTYQAMAPALNPFEFLHNPPPGTVSPPAQPAASQPDTPRPAGSVKADEIAKLQQQIAELERAVSSLRPEGAVSGTEHKPKKRPNRKAPAQKK